MELGTKAAVGAGTIPLSSAIVTVGLWLCGATPPNEIVLAMQAILAVPVAYAATYYSPHNGASPPP